MPLSALERYRRPGILALAPDALTEPDDGTDPAFNPNAANATTPPEPRPPSSEPTSAALDQPTPLNGKPALTPGGANGTKNLAIMPPPGAPPAQIQEPPSAAPAPPQVPGTPPKAGISANVPASPLDQNLQKESADIQTERAALKRPDAPNSNWAQRLGTAVLSMTKFAPAANQIVHPKWSADEANYERKLGDLATREKQVNSQETTGAQAAYKEAMAQQAAQTGEARLTSAATRAQTEQDRAKEAQDKIAQLKSATYQKSIQERLKGRETDSVYQKADDPMPPGYEFIENKEEPGMGWATPPAWHATPAELVPFAPGYKVGDQMSHSAFKTATADFNKNKLADTTAANKPEPAGAAKQAFQATMTKLAAEPGLLNAGAVTDVNQIFTAIKSSKTLSPEEKNSALAYITANPTPQATGTNVTARDIAQQLSRIFPTLNTNTKRLELRNSKEINEGDGTYAPASGGATALTKEAVFKDLHYNIDTARNAIQSLESMDSGTRAALSIAMRHSDPSSALQTFLTGQLGTHLTDQQQDAVIALAQLSENALSLRSVAGMGAGSDDLRAAIQNVLPSGKSPSVGYALKQLANFEQVVSRLETSVPDVSPKQPGTGRAGAAQIPGAKKSVTAAQITEFARGEKITDAAARAQFIKDGYEITK